MRHRPLLILVLLLPAALAGSGLAAGHSFDAGAHASSQSAVVIASDPGRAISPGGVGEVIRFTIRNDEDAGAMPTRVSVRVASDSASGDAKAASGAVIRGCLARWFRVVGRLRMPRLPVLLRAGASYRGVFILRMLDAPVNQDACRGSRPAVAVTVQP